MGITSKTPAMRDLVAQHLNLDPALLDRLAMQKQPVIPA
jgi:hypothetical protein